MLHNINCEGFSSGGDLFITHWMKILFFKTAFTDSALVEATFIRILGFFLKAI